LNRIESKNFTDNKSELPIKNEITLETQMVTETFPVGAVEF